MVRHQQMTVIFHRFSLLRQCFPQINHEKYFCCCWLRCRLLVRLPPWSLRMVNRSTLDRVVFSVCSMATDSPSCIYRKIEKGEERKTRNETVYTKKCVEMNTATEANYAIKSIFEIFNLRRSLKHAKTTSVRSFTQSLSRAFCVSLSLAEDISLHFVIMIIMMTVLRNGINRLSNQSA